MKINKYIIGLLSATLLFSSCKKFVDVNQNPNAPTDVPPSLLLPTTQVGIANASSGELGRAASVLVQHNAGIGSQQFSFDQFVLDGLGNNSWDYELFIGSINNLVIMINKTQATSPAYAGIAKIQMAYAFSLLTDLWGDVPYSQGGQGLLFPQPRYDKQQDIYEGNTGLGITSLFDMVRNGIADLGKTTVLAPSAADDMIYKGDLLKWKRAGYSLMLKLANTISVVNPTLAKTVTTEVITANNYINANNLDFEVPFGTATGSQSYHYAFNVVNRPLDQMLSTRFVTLVRGLNDTVRLGKLYTKPGGLFVSTNNGAAAPTGASTAALRSVFSSYIVGTAGEAPVRMLTNFQSNLNLAENIVRLGITGNADSLYKAGIRAHMTKIGMTTTEIATYFTDNPLAVTLTGTTANQLQQIVTQKYIAYTGMEIEAYNDYRRTGIPTLALPLVTQGDNPSVIPKRYPYVSSELSSNPNAPNPRTKTDVKVWWGL
ncbi:MAG: SusD/RagB family nutrient-binding outer membrane lipoprotein [Ferruginibacter sp.]